MYDWIITLTVGAAAIAFGILANSKIGTVRKTDQRPHQLPWGLIMIGCVFVVFMVVVHIMNLVGIETGPEHSLFGRF